MESVIALDKQQRIYGLSVNEIRRMAFEIGERHGLSHPFDNTKKMAGGTGWTALVERWTGWTALVERWTGWTAMGFNKPQVDKFFGIWRALLEELG